jgi:hypothetical protein
MAHQLVEPLRPSFHVRDAFASGQALHDRYLRELAHLEMAAQTGSTFVLTAGDSPRVLGFYTLCLGIVGLAGPQRGFPSRVCTTLMNRLAIQKYSRGNPQELLFLDALKRSWQLSRRNPTFAIVVDVRITEPDPAPFYESYGLKPLPGHPGRLFLPLATCKSLFT